MKYLDDLLRIAMSLLVVAAGFAVYFVLMTWRSSPEKTEVVAKAILVETTPVGAHGSGLVIPVDGVVVPYREIQVAAEVGGVIDTKSPNCRAGKFVQQGELLFQIEKDYYQKELEILQKELEQAGRTIAELDIEKANLTKLISIAEEQEKIEQDQEQRYRGIRENNARLLTEREYDEQRLALLSVQNQLITLRNQETLLETRRLRFERAKEQTQLQIDRAMLDLERTEITAPIAGVVVKDFVEEDSYVAKGTVVAALEDISKVEVRCNLRMDEMYWVWRQPTETTGADDSSEYYRIPRTPVKVIYDLAGRKLVWEGALTRYDGIGVDEATRTVPCRVVIEEPRSEVSGAGGDSRNWSGPPALVRGMYVTVEVETRPADTLLEIPELALKPNETVWVVRDGKLLIRKIDVVEVHAGKVIFTENGTGESERIRPRDRVVVTPLPGAYDGMPVRETEAVNGAKDKGRTPPSESGSSPNEGERRLREESALPEAKIPSKKTPSAVPGPSPSTGGGR